MNRQMEHELMLSPSADSDTAVWIIHSLEHHIHSHIRHFIGVVMLERPEQNLVDSPPKVRASFFCRAFQ